MKKVWIFVVIIILLLGGYLVYSKTDIKDNYYVTFEEKKFDNYVLVEKPKSNEVTFTKKAFDKIKEKYALLGKKVKTFNYNEIEYIKTNFPEAVDKYGEIDPRGLTKEQISILKQRELDRLNSLYYENMGVSIEDGDSFDRSLITASNVKIPILIKRANSNYDTDFVYEVGKTISVDNFNDNRWEDCSTGIHFFLTRDEAVRY